MKERSAHKKDRILSAIITIVVFLILLLCLYFYRYTKITTHSEKVVTTMLVNFGTSENGTSSIEPAPIEGSLASSENTQKVSENDTKNYVEETNTTKQKIYTGTSQKTTTTKHNKQTKKKVATKKSTNQKKKSTNSRSKTSNTSDNSKGDGKGKAAIGNLLKGRGSTKGSQGTKGNSGNAGDPLGGSGNGDSTVGIDRKLISYIPGTMGRGGQQPSHTCEASGTIKISYIVDPAGRVISAKRLNGISDPCAVRTTVAWVKKYVKAEKADTSSKGTYSIRF